MFCWVHLPSRLASNTNSKGLRSPGHPERHAALDLGRAWLEGDRAGEELSYRNSGQKGPRQPDKRTERVTARLVASE